MKLSLNFGREGSDMMLTFYTRMSAVCYFSLAISTWNIASKNGKVNSTAAVTTTSTKFKVKG